MSKNKNISFWGEMGLLNTAASVLLIVLVIGCFAFYAFMSSSPSKKIVVEDDADIFTSSEIDELEDLARSLSRDKDINVVIVTTRDKGRGYSDSDEDCARFAGDYYANRCIRTSLVNNSGICIFIDLTQDYPGGRFFWIYTYGTAFFAIDDDECTRLFNEQRSELTSGDYYGAVKYIIRELKGFDYSSTAPLTFFCLIIPAGLALLVTMIATSAKPLDKKPESQRYIDGKPDIKLTDRVTKTQKIRHESSSGGGISSGGGGFSGGGFSGGGHSGGGGGRF